VAELPWASRPVSIQFHIYLVLKFDFQQKIFKFCIFSFFFGFVNSWSLVKERTGLIGATQGQSINLIRPSLGRV